MKTTVEMIKGYYHATCRFSGITTTCSAPQKGETIQVAEAAMLGHMKRYEKNLGVYEIATEEGFCAFVTAGGNQ